MGESAAQGNAGPQSPRVAGLDDAEEVAELLDRFQREYDGVTPGVAVLTSRVRSHSTGGLSDFLLARPPRVGVAQLRFREYLHTGTPVCLLEELYVVPHRRGEGHGRALLGAAIALARDRGASCMELGTATGDTAARGLYESFGFTNLEKAGDPRTQMLFYERSL